MVMKYFQIVNYFWPPLPYARQKAAVPRKLLAGSTSSYAKTVIFCNMFLIKVLRLPDRFGALGEAFGGKPRKLQTDLG